MKMNLDDFQIEIPLSTYLNTREWDDNIFDLNIFDNGLSNNVGFDTRNRRVSLQ